MIKEISHWTLIVSFTNLFKSNDSWMINKLQFSSVAQLCLTLHNPMDCSTPRPPWPSPTLRVYSNSCPLSQLMASNSLILCHPVLLLPSIFPSIRIFSNEWVLTSGRQIIGVSALALVLPMYIQDWFPLGWTGGISLLSKGLSRVFSNTTVQKNQFLSTQVSL